MKPAIEVHHVTGDYRPGATQNLRQIAGRARARLLGRAVAGPAPFKALDNVSFLHEIHRLSAPTTAVWWRHRGLSWPAHTGWSRGARR